jgi:6-phosphogluconolactonase
VIGDYTSAGGPGVAAGTADPDTGTLTVEQATTAVSEPSWLAAGPSGLYVISEQDAGTVSTLDPATLAVRATVPTGSGPAHVAVHPAGSHLFVSAYGGGTVSTHPIDADGIAGPATDTRSQGSGSHAHQVVIDPSGAYVLAVDLGRDSVFVYTLDGDRLVRVRRVTLAAGSGPRHLVFHPGGTVAYLANENDSTVTVGDWSDGVLTARDVLAAAEAVPGVTNYPAEIALSADAAHLYVSNRGTDTVGVFGVSPDGGTLARVAGPSCGGVWPRHLALDSSGRWMYVANQRSGTVTALPIDPATGVPGPVAATLPVPGAAQVLLL